MITRTMPSFGLPSSICVASSPSPGVSNLLPSGSDTSGLAVPDGCMANLFDNPYLHPPPLSLSDAAPYSPPPFPLGPHFLSSARIPPPPNPSFGRPVANHTAFFESSMRVNPEPRADYEHWTDTNISGAYGSDNISRCASHCPVPTFNPSNDNASNLGAEGLFPPLTPYPPLDRFTKSIPRYSTFSRESSAISNAAVMSSSAPPAVSSPLPPGHFSSCSPDLPVDFPLSSTRFSFNPLAPTFIPGMDPSPTPSPCNPELSPEPFPSYLSRTGPFLPSSAFQAPDYFHDASSRSVQSPETAPRPMRSNSPSCFRSPHPYNSRGSLSTPTAILPFSGQSRNNGSLDFTHSSEDSNVFHHEPSSYPLTSSLPFPPPSSLPYPPPIPEIPLFSPYSSAPSLPETYSIFCPGESNSDKENDNVTVDRITIGTDRGVREHPTREVMFREHSTREDMFREHPTREDMFRWKLGLNPGANDGDDLGLIIGRDTARLIDQNLSPEESRWDHYGPVDPDVIACLFGQTSPEPYNHFRSVDSALPNTTNELMGKGGSSLASLKSQKEQSEILLRSKAPQNQSGPSLKVAASALVEMIAMGTNGSTYSSAPTVLGPLPSNTFDDFTYDAPVNADVDGQERLSGDFGSSGFGGCQKVDLSDLAVGLKVGRSSRPTSCSPTRTRRGAPYFVGNTIPSFSDVPPARTMPRTSGIGSLNPRMSWMADVVPQSAKGGPLHAYGQRRVFARASAGILRQPLMSSASAKLHGVNAETNTSPNLELLPESSDRCLKSDSGNVRKFSSESVGALSSEDPSAIVGPCAAKPVGSGVPMFDLHQEIASTGLENQLSDNNQWSVKPSSRESSPNLSQGDADSCVLRNTKSSSTIFTNLKWSSPEGSSQNETACLTPAFHSLTTTISNLSKVLLALDSSSLTPTDSAALEETRNTMLRLSKCLLEESKTNVKSMRISPGSAASVDGRVVGSLTGFDLLCHAETEESSNMAELKVPEIYQTDIPTQVYKSNDLRTISTVSRSESIGSGMVHNDANNRSNLLVIDCEAVAGKESPVNSSKSAGESSSYLTSAMTHDVMNLLQSNGIHEVSSLKQLIDAEAQLKMTVQLLREELEFEREENRGTAFLCERIIQEGGTKAVRRATEGIEAPLQLSLGRLSPQMEFSPERPAFESPIPNPHEIAESLNTSRMSPETTSCFGKGSCGNSNKAGNLNSAIRGGWFLEDLDIDQLQSCLLAQRVPHYPQMVQGHCIDQGVQAPLGSTHGNISHQCGDGQVELQQTATTQEFKQPNASDHKESCLTLRDASGDVDEVQSRLALLQARPSASEDVDPVETHLSVLQARPSASRDIGQIQSRLSLLQARPGWDNYEFGVFTETEPCTPAQHSASEANINTGILEEHPAVVKHELESIPTSASHGDTQSEPLSTKQTNWGPFSAPVESEVMRSVCKPEVVQEGAGFVHASTQPHDDSRVVGEQDDVSSLHFWKECGPNGESSENGVEDSLGAKHSNLTARSVTGYIFSYEDGRSERLNEISLVRRLDNEGNGTQFPAEDVKSNVVVPGLKKDQCVIGSADNEMHLTKELSSSSSQGSDEDAGWEHIHHTPCQESVG